MFTLSPTYSGSLTRSRSALKIFQTILLTPLSLLMRTEDYLFLTNMEQGLPSTRDNTLSSQVLHTNQVVTSNGILPPSPSTMLDTAEVLYPPS